MERHMGEAYGSICWPMQDPKCLSLEFQSLDRYCVAPIVFGQELKASESLMRVNCRGPRIASGVTARPPEEPLASYDFWAATCPALYC